MLSLAADFVRKDVESTFGRVAVSLRIEAAVASPRQLHYDRFCRQLGSKSSVRLLALVPPIYDAKMRDDEEVT